MMGKEKLMLGSWEAGKVESQWMCFDAEQVIVLMLSAEMFVVKPNTFYNHKAKFLAHIFVFLIFSATLRIFHIIPINFANPSQIYPRRIAEIDIYFYKIHFF